jgi:hypothetical protein
MLYGRLLLALGYLSAPFAGPGSAVITSAGWLVYGSETGKPTYGWVGLAGLLGVAGVLAGKYGAGMPGLEGVGGVLLLLYYVLSIALLWIVGVRSGNGALKVAAAALAVAFVLAASGTPTVDDAAVAASGSVVDWGGLSWANAAAHSFIEAIGGPAALARVAAAVGAVFAAIGFMGLQEASQSAAREEAIFGIGVY